MNLVIGDSSQLFPYFKEYDPNIMGVSARNFDIKNLNGKFFDKVFLTFAEQRLHLDEGVDFFAKVNVTHTLKIINELKPFVKTFIVYSTSDLWDLCEGGITLKTPRVNRGTSYAISKMIMEDEINNLRVKENIDIRIIYPFNFSSPYRRSHFLFHKFMEVILYNKKITVGDLDFSRDIINPKLVVDVSFNTKEDIIVGSGILTNVKQFYIDILENFSIIYNDMVVENTNTYINPRKCFFLETENKYTSLLEDTIHDIRKYKNSIS
jgi:nucleoside-diphosphate-sugar epimerase